MPDLRGHYVRNKDGTWTWVGSHAELIAYWYFEGRKHGRQEAEKEAKRAAPGS